MNSDFTFWGHNCFLIETATEALLIDPWLNETGAFFGSWHQWPPNGHLRQAVEQRCATKSLRIFLSHEHQDHFDKETLRRFASHPDCTVFVPAYEDKFLLKALRGLDLHAVELAEGEPVGESIRFRIFIDDGGINHDSAIFIATQGFTFFNQNDCKLFDRLPRLVREFGRVDYYSVQFSGANWHPACFDMSADQRRIVARKKVLSKFRNVRDAVKLIDPRFFVPAAGPAFFPSLDAALNTGVDTIFVHQDELDKYLNHNGIANVLYPWPGEPITDETNRTPIAGPTAGELERYRSSHRNMWDELEDTFSKERFGEVLRQRLDAIAHIALPPDIPLIAFNWGNDEADWLLVDLSRKALVYSNEPEPPCLVLTASTRYFSLMCGQDRWQDIALSLRASVKRLPDVYNTIVNIFLFSDESNLAASMVQNINSSKERIVVEHCGEKYEINRYCPHQGGDLTYASVDHDMHLVCPRHSWRFDLGGAGMCKTSGMSINAVKLKG